MLRDLAEEAKKCGLELHPSKTKILSNVKTEEVQKHIPRSASERKVLKSCRTMDRQNT